MNYKNNNTKLFTLKHIYYIMIKQYQTALANRYIKKGVFNCGYFTKKH